MIDSALVVDDELLACQFLEETVRRQGIEVYRAGSGEEAIELVKEHDFQLAFVDLKMGEVSGLDVLRFIRTHAPNVAVVVITAYGTVETAVEAMRIGAFDFVIKPFSPDQVDVLIEKARKWMHLNVRHEFLGQELSAPGGLEKSIIGSSAQMLEVDSLVKRVAPTNATVLITGESGTGKELIARELHRFSDPAGTRSYIRMNCAAVPETLLESELFGHEKGAFTGAHKRRIGRFELADGGTLLLDEIGEISFAMQSKLLRVLQESEFERVGGTKTIKVNVRVITSTNRDLAREVAEGNFREDLYYRMNVFPIHLPALRERSGDIEEIAEYFLRQQERNLRRKLVLTSAAKVCISAYHWPGNIRELENVIERVAILEDGPEIGPESLPPEIRNPVQPQAASGSDCYDLHEMERKTIYRALVQTGGNRLQAADLLGFSVRTLRNKLNEYARVNEVESIAV